jgi:hypothetical protein
MGLFLALEMGYLCRIWLDLANVRFWGIAAIKSARNHDFKGPESAKGGHKYPLNQNTSSANVGVFDAS